LQHVASKLYQVSKMWDVPPLSIKNPKVEKLCSFKTMHTLRPMCFIGVLRLCITHGTMCTLYRVLGMCTQKSLATCALHCLGAYIHLEAHWTSYSCVVNVNVSFHFSRSCFTFYIIKSVMNLRVNQLKLKIPNKIL
jgi:hypothetical protein